jgi:hypothetical protein
MSENELEQHSIARLRPEMHSEYRTPHPGFLPCYPGAQVINGRDDQHRLWFVIWERRERPGIKIQKLRG